MSASAAINAANAQFSTGARTPAGKDRIKLNALKTGLFAQTIVLPHEDQAAYDAIGEGITEDFEPRTPEETELARTIQISTWRILRAVSLDFSLYAMGALEHLEATQLRFPDQSLDAQYSLAQAAAFFANSRVFDQLSRQEARLHRMLDRAKRELRALVNSRLPEPDPTPQPVVAPAVTPAVTPAAAPSVASSAASSAAPSAAPVKPAPIALIPENGFVPSKYPKNMPRFSGPQAKEHRRLWLRKNAAKNMA